MKTDSAGRPMIECPRIDRDAIAMDESGYWFLIRPNFRYGHIEAAVCHADAPTLIDDSKNIVEIYFGVCAQDVYHKILNDTKYVTSRTHAAYLGKELKKAELALALGIQKFYQE